MPPYELKVKELEHEQEFLTAQLKSCEAKLKCALEEIKTFRADIEKFRYLFSRGEAMFKSSAISEDYVVDQKRNLNVAIARMAAAEHRAEALKHECAALHARIKKNHAALKLENIWRNQTTVNALSDGYVINMTLSPGGYYKPGEVLFAFVDSSAWYVQANFKESELSEIKNGTQAVSGCGNIRDANTAALSAASAGAWNGGWVLRVPASPRFKRKMNGLFCRRGIRYKSESLIRTKICIFISAAVPMWNWISRPVRSGNFSGSCFCGDEKIFSGGSIGGMAVVFRLCQSSGNV